MDATPNDAAAEANRLYWETELPVGDIAARLDLSRRALYEAIRPVPADGQCAACGATLEYSKRSSRTHGLATCSSCGAQAAASGTAAERETEPWTWSPPTRMARGSLLAGPAPSMWVLAGAALAGALCAAGATLLVIRSRARG
ncbi:MAG: hypothetical protein FIB01_02140 [Gemmatimonadetes bacterium]|nr:hypothetical protein [Gemmatimonadota bacterium]